MGYGRITVNGLFSENSNYSDPSAQTFAGIQEETPVSFYHQKLTVPVAGVGVGPGLALDFQADAGFGGLNLDDISAILIKNTQTSGANYLTVNWFSDLETIANPGVSGGFRFYLSSSKIVDDNTSGKFANVALGDILFTDNAETANNRKSYSVTEVTSSSEVVVNPNPSSDDSADVTATFSRGRLNEVQITAGKWLVIPGNLMYRTTATTQFIDLNIYATGGTVTCEVFAIGT